VNHLGLASIFKKVNAVVTITSNVGLEAAICGLPVLCLGKPVYSGKGFTLDWDGESDLASYLTKVFGFSSHEDAKADFLYTLKKEVLFSLDDPPDNLTRLCTPDSFTPTPDPRSPFWNKGCGEFSQYFQLKEDYARYVYQNYTYSEAMTRLGDEPINAKEQSLFSGERQTAFWRGDIDAAHKARYGFAALFLPPEGHVLDAGCGVGYGTQFLARQTPASFLAFDACQEAVDYANTVYHSENIRYTCVSAGGFVDQHLLKCQNTFDLIVAFEFLEHILSPELLIKKIKQKLSDDGVFVGSVPFSEGYPIGNHSFHFKHYDLLSLNQILDIKPDEHVRFFYQEGTTIDKKPAGKSIIFVLTKDKNKLTCLEENLPFLYHDQKEKDEAFVPAVFFLSPHVAQPTLSSGIPLRVEHQDQDFFFYGPYLSLPAGAWEVRFVFKEGGGKDKTDMPVSLPDHALPDSFLDETAGQEPPPNTPFNHSLMLDVVGDQGNAIYFEEAFELTALLNAPPIKIRVDSSDEKLEFRARRALINDAPTELPETDVIFLGVKLKRLPDTTLPEIPPPRKR
jgi:2-polyprenyl-3-methyl-5-hydroxy-6-metoxy-1,4-benzoquinol methylase